MRKIAISLTLILTLASINAFSQQTLIGYWNFNSGANGTAWTAPINANSGVGNAKITAGTWTWGNILYTEGFAGNAMNALNGDPAGASLSLRHQGMNGNYIQFEFSMEGYVSLVLSYWTQKTATGFASNQWSWSTNGTTYTNFGSIVNPDASPGSVVTISVPAEVNNNATVYLRYTLNGATADTGNNRIDNVQLNATAYNPDQVSNPVFSPASGTYYEPQEVSISTFTENANIYYTLNGIDPTESDILFTTPITIEGATTIKAKAFKSGLSPSNVVTAEYAIRDIIYIKDFEDESLTSGGWSTYSVASDKNWLIGSFGGGANSTSFYAEMNGYQQDVLSNDWLISPVYDLSAYNEVNLSFFTQKKYGTVDSELMLKYSVDYVSGNPTAATWTEIAFTKPSGEDTWVSSGILDIPEVGNIRFAFHYLATSNPTRWRVDEIIISEAVSTIDNANLAVFKVDDINLLSMSGIVVDDPELDAGATLLVLDFSAIQGITVSTVNPLATFVVEKNAVVVNEVDFATLTFAEGDVLVVTVTAEDGTTILKYKVTLALDTREIIFVTPVGGEEYQTGDAILIEWTSQSLDFLDLYVYKEGNTTAVAQYFGIDAADGAFTDILPNGVHGTHYFRLYDSSDNNFFVQSENVTFIDNLNPEFISLFPANGAIDISTKTNLIITFNEDVFANTGSIVIHRSLDDSVFESINITGAQVTITNNVVLINPVSNLEFITEYYILIDNGAIEDIGGNPFVGISLETIWSFTTMEQIELICNGDFELWTDDLPNCWYGPKSTIDAANVLQYNEDAYSGQYAVQLVNDTPDHKRFTSAPTTVENGACYMITFYVKGQGEFRTGLFDDRAGDSYGFAPYNPYTIINSTEWLMKRQVVSALKDYSSAEFVFSIKNTNADNNHLLIDNVSVEEIICHTQEFTTLAELRDGLFGLDFLYSGEGIVTFKQSYRNQVFIQDATGGMLLDDLPGILSYNYALGDGISNITGKLDSYLGMLQLQPKADPGAPSSIGNPIIATNRTIAEVTSADQARLVKVSQLDFTSSGTFATGTPYNITDPSGNGVFRTNFFNADYIGNSIPSQTINLVAIVHEANGVIQLTARSTSDFQEYVNVNNPEIGNITVYPNPFSSTLNFIIGDDVVEVVMYNNMGQEYRRLDVSGSQLQIETSEMNSGIYFVRFIMNDGSQMTKKLIKY